MGGRSLFRTGADNLTKTTQSPDLSETSANEPQLSVAKLHVSLTRRQNSFSLSGVGGALFNPNRAPARTDPASALLGVFDLSGRDLEERPERAFVSNGERRR